ncbi:hypothetical protein [Hymenobacter gelipurpurascens]|nr:hypothetical protein [Hymenobacter gelipurpurascens]
MASSSSRPPAVTGTTSVRSRLASLRYLGQRKYSIDELAERVQEML